MENMLQIALRKENWKGIINVTVEWKKIQTCHLPAENKLQILGKEKVINDLKVLLL